MKKLSILTALLLTLFFTGCGSSTGDTQSQSGTIAAGDTQTLPAGTTISASSGTCAPNIVVNLDGTWDVTNPSNDDNDICQYN